MALIVSSLLLRDKFPYLFYGTFGLMIVVAVNELLNLLGGDDKTHPVMLRATDCALGLSIFALVASSLSGFCLIGITLVLLALLLFLFLFRIIVQLYLKECNALSCIQRTMTAMMYVALPLSLINVICGVLGSHFMIAVFVFIWLNDTAAFLVGISIGKHRLWERISPKKSWEGFVGGMVVTAVAAWFCPTLFGDFFTFKLTGIQWALVGVTVSAAATFGDLFESLLKRTAGVKDSGKILPGHGGLLDRIDSLLLVAPSVCLVLLLFAAYE